jgi:AcrR family transcriptional regulator
MIAAALTDFSELGFNQATMQDIRCRAGVSNGSLYHHFKSKNALAAAVYLQGIIDYQTGLLAALERQTEARAGIEAIVRHHLTWVSEQKEWAGYLTRMRHAAFISELERPIAEQNLLFMERIVKWFSPRVAAGDLREVPFDLLIPLIIGPCQEFTRFLLEGKARTGIKAAADEMARAAWLALRGGSGR